MRATRFVRRVDAHLQPILEAHALEIEVLLRERELVVEAHFARVVGGERRAQQIAEIADRFLGEPRILAHEGRDRVERVEQEVRPQARFDVRQLACASATSSCAAR